MPYSSFPHNHNANNSIKKGGRAKKLFPPTPAALLFLPFSTSWLEAKTFSPPALPAAANPLLSTAGDGTDEEEDGSSSSSSFSSLSLSPYPDCNQYRRGPREEEEEEPPGVGLDKPTHVMPLLIRKSKINIAPNDRGSSFCTKDSFCSNVLPYISHICTVRRTLLFSSFSFPPFVAKELASLQISLRERASLHCSLVSA